MLLSSRFLLALAVTASSMGCNSSSSSTASTASTANGGAPKPADSAGSGTPSNVVHTTPVCAVQDCATHKVVDNGCTPSGECASCINFCPPQNSITVAPSSTPLNQH